MQHEVDVVVIGGGQAALATAYFLKRTSLRYVVLDNQTQAGGAWLHTWDSLELFSPSSWSSLPGWFMPKSEGEYPTKSEVLDYLTRYESKYGFPIIRPVNVTHIQDDDDFVLVHSKHNTWKAKAVISATGTWSNPFIPNYDGFEHFTGLSIHSAHYKNAEILKDKQVLIIGGGNSGAQLVAEVSKVAHTTWITKSPPAFLPDDVDGRVLFLRATERLKAQQEGKTIEEPLGGFGDVVMIKSVVEARERGVLTSKPPFSYFTENSIVWENGESQHVDAVIWCTGFRPAISYLDSTGLIESNGKISLNGTRSIKKPNLWFVGYGDWCGAASATLIGVSRTARSTVEEVASYLNV